MGSEVKTSSDFDLQTLDVLLDAVAEHATRAGVKRKDFYQVTSQRMLAGTDSVASTIWVCNEKDQLRMAGQSGWDSLEGNRKEKLQALIRDQLAATGKKTAMCKLPFGVAYCGGCKPGNGFRFLFLLLRNAGDPPLLGQVFQDLVAEVVGQIEAFENARTAEQPDHSAHDLTQLAQLIQNAGKSSSFKQLAFHLVNDLAKITKADRVTYLDNSGGIQAISGTASVSYRTAIVRTLASLGRSVLVSRHPVDWQNEQINFDGKRSPRNVKKFIAETETPRGYVVPFENEGRLFGAVILEYFNDSEHSVEQRQLINEVIEFASPVVARSSQFHAIPAIGLQNFFFNRLLSSSVRLMSGVVAAILILGLVCYGLFVVHQPFEIYGEGVLEPISKQHVFAQTDGEVKVLFVEENATVEAGQKLLEIESRNLEKEFIEVEGEIAEVQQQLRNFALTEIDKDIEDVIAEETRRASEVERLKIRLDALKERLSFFEDRQSKQQVVAPLAGVITTSGLRRRLVDRPINRGDLLMSVAQTNGQWQVEMKIPDNRVEFIEAAMKESSDPLVVQFRLKSDSSLTREGGLEKLDYRSFQRENVDESRVSATVSIDEQKWGASLRLGARVLGKIECGQRSNFYLLTYEMRNRINEWLFW